MSRGEAIGATGAATGLAGAGVFSKKKDKVSATAAKPHKILFFMLKIFSGPLQRLSGGTIRFCQTGVF